MLEKNKSAFLIVLCARSKTYVSHESLEVKLPKTLIKYDLDKKVLIVNVVDLNIMR